MVNPIPQSDFDGELIQEILADLAVIDDADIDQAEEWFAQNYPEEYASMNNAAID